MWLLQSSHSDDSELQATNDILSLFVRHLDRWKSIVFCFSANVVPKALMDLPHGAAVSLEAARVDAQRWDRASADNPCRALHSPPTLGHPTGQIFIGAHCRAMCHGLSSRKSYWRDRFPAMWYWASSSIARVSSTLTCLTLERRIIHLQSFSPTFIIYTFQQRLD
jgi:hypothetical protein